MTPGDEVGHYLLTFGKTLQLMSVWVVASAAEAMCKIVRVKILNRRCTRCTHLNLTPQSIDGTELTLLGLAAKAVIDDHLRQFDTDPEIVEAVVPASRSGIVLDKILLDPIHL
jgi:hypothetical protein